MRTVLCRVRAVEEPGEQVKTTLRPPKRPAQCRGYFRQRLTENFPKIVDEFVENGKQASVHKMKYINEVLDSPGKAKAKEMGTRTLSRWVREMREGR